MDNPFQSPAIISFCPGILGLERGLKRAGVHPRVIAYVEIEAFIIANLVAGMESGLLDPAPIWTDAKTFDARPLRGKLHGIIGGYPCPGESTAGLRQGHLYKGFIWPAIRRAFAAARPLFGFFENVDDHLTGTYPIVQRSLRNMGYAVEAGIYSAEEVGAPHERQRLFILAILADGNCYGPGDCAGNSDGKSKAPQSKEQRKEWNELLREWMRAIVGQRSAELADTICNNGAEVEKENGNTIIGSQYLGHGQTRRNDRFPTGQGFEQYNWEASRVTESGLGCTVNGYNYREDLLRALGNSVVEQTAELAFTDLLNKHLKNLK